MTLLYDRISFQIFIYFLVFFSYYKKFKYEIEKNIKYIEFQNFKMNNFFNSFPVKNIILKNYLILIILLKAYNTL